LIIDQMMRVISSPSISTIGLFTLITGHTLRVFSLANAVPRPPSGAGARVLDNTGTAAGKAPRRARATGAGA
jgi:hypothetical protein